MVARVLYGEGSGIAPYVYIVKVSRPINLERIMKFPHNEAEYNENHNGTIWSKRLRVAAAIIATLVLALANAGPSIAAGIGHIGK